MIGRQEIEQLAKAVLGRCRGGQAEVLVNTDEQALTRFANNAIHQNVAETNLSLTVRYFAGKRAGTAITNRSDPAALDEVVAQARLNAEASPEDPNFIGLAEPAPVPEARAFDEETAEYPPAGRGAQVAAVCRVAAEKGLNASGAFSTGASELAVANTAGVFAYHPSTGAEFQVTVMSADSSGRAQASAWRAGELDVEALGGEAIGKAERGRLPQRIEPGEYPVILDPYAAYDLLWMLGVYGAGGQAVMEGRSWMSDRQGQALMSPLVSIKDDGLDPAGLPLPFDFEGQPRQRVDIVTNGVIGEAVYDRYLAQKAGRASTGHAMPPNFRFMGPIPTNVFMTPGQASTQEMIAGMRRGLYITRFWYTRIVHPRDCVITGMTRDGVFWVENGEIAYPVKNLRFTQSYVEAMARLEQVGAQTRLLSSDYGAFSARAPALKIGAFNFTGVTV
jgi:predicted Zn-dependent protease